MRKGRSNTRGSVLDFIVLILLCFEMERLTSTGSVTPEYARIVAMDSEMPESETTFRPG